MASEVDSTALQPHSNLLWCDCLFVVSPSVKQVTILCNTKCQVLSCVTHWNWWVIVNLKSSDSGLEPSVLVYEQTNTYPSVLRNRKCVNAYREEV